MDATALTAKEKAEILRLARRALDAYVRTGVVLSYNPEEGALSRQRDVFVTLREKGQLRGCVGFLAANQPLYRMVMESAIAAATEDPRFSPVQVEELTSIIIQVSILSAARRITHLDEIQLGRHGLVIHQGPARGLLLPQVPIEQGWDRQSFVEHTCRKAGLGRNAWRSSAVMEVFTAEIFGEV